MNHIFRIFLILILAIAGSSCNKPEDDPDDPCGSLGCWTTVTIEEVSGNVYDIIYDGSQWIAVGYKEADGIDQPTLWHSTDMSTWTSVNIYTVTSSSKAYTVVYDRTRWIVGGGDHSNTENKAVIWYSTSLSDAWIKKVMDNSGGGGAAVYGLYYDSSDGRYLAAGQIGHESGTAMAWHIGGDPTGTWESVELASDANASCVARRSSDNMWLVGGQIDGSPAYGAVWVLESDFSGNPVRLPILTDTESDVSAVAESTADGKDIAVGYLLVDNGTYAYLWHTESGTLSWTEMNFTLEQWAREVDLVYNGSRWLAVSKNRIWYANSITGDLVENETDGSVTCGTITYSSTNNTWMIGGSHNETDYPVILYLSGE